MQKRTLRIFILTLIKDAYCPLRVFFQIFFFQLAAAASAVDAGQKGLSLQFAAACLPCRLAWCNAKKEGKQKKKHLSISRGSKIIENEQIFA